MAYNTRSILTSSPLLVGCVWGLYDIILGPSLAGQPLSRTTPVIVTEGKEIMPKLTHTVSSSFHEVTSELLTFLWPELVTWTHQTALLWEGQQIFENSCPVLQAQQTVDSGSGP